LHVETPNGRTINYLNDFDPDSGGELDHDDIPMAENGGSVEAARGRYVENIVFPLDQSAPVGQYAFHVDVYDQVGELDSWTVAVYLNDVEVVSYSGTGDSDLFTFEL